MERQQKGNLTICGCYLVLQFNSDLFKFKISHSSKKILAVFGNAAFAKCWFRNWHLHEGTKKHDMKWKGGTEIIESLTLAPQIKRQNESQRLRFTLTLPLSVAARGALKVKVCVCVRVFLCVCMLVIIRVKIIRCKCSCWKHAQLEQTKWRYRDAQGSMQPTLRSVLQDAKITWGVQDTSC